MGVQLRRYDVMRASDRTLPTVSASQNNKNRQSYQRRTSHGAMRTNEEAIHCYRNDRLKIFLGAQIMRRDTGKRLPSSPNPHVVNIQQKGSERLTSMRRAQIPQTARYGHLCPSHQARMRHSSQSALWANQTSTAKGL